MFRRLFEQYMRTEPETVDQKYIFIVDNSDLALSIADAGFQTVALEEQTPNLFTLDSFCSYLAGLELKGTCMTDYMYVCDWDVDQGWHDARITPLKPIELAPQCVVLHYAQETFEGLKAYRRADGKIQLFRPEMNAKRMIKSNE